MNVIVHYIDGQWTCEIDPKPRDGSVRIIQRPFESRKEASLFAEAVMLGYKIAGQQLSDPFLDIAEEWETEG